MSRTRLRAETFDGCVERARELRARSYTPLRAGAPSWVVGAGAGVSFMEEKPRFRARVLESGTRFEFFVGPVQALLRDQGAEELLVRERTRWDGSYAHTVFWAPLWVACFAFGHRFLPTGWGAEIDALGLRDVAFEALRTSAEAQAGLVAMFVAHVDRIQLALESAELLGGREAVETILIELGL